MMAQTTIILSIVAVVLVIINAKKNGRHIEGIRLGLKQFIQTALLIIGAFMLAGIIEVIIPRDFVKNWLSTQAGLRGIVIGTLGGMLLAIGPYAFFPIVASILVSGAGLGTIVSTITGWCLLGMSKMPYETAFLGIKFYMQKLLFSIPFSLIAGIIAYVLEISFLG